MTTFDEKMKTAHRIIGQKIGKNYYGNVYIGITNNVKRRYFENHYDQMDDFVILYQTTSRDLAIKAEKELIQYIKNKYEYESCNIGKGGEGVSHGSNTYYVYAVFGYSCTIK